MQTKQYNDMKTEAKRLGVAPRTLDRRIKDEQFPFIRFGNRVLFDPELSDQYLAARVQHGRAAELSREAA